MPAGRATVTIGGLALVADLSHYRPFGAAGEWPLGVTVFDGPGSTTIQDFGRRIKRAMGRLTTGGPATAGLISRATLISLLGLMQTRGATQSLSDSLGNAGTIKPLTFGHVHEHAVPGSQGTLYSFELTWRWVACTTLYGSAYTGA
jgi:hypothetical protein